MKHDVVVEGPESDVGRHDVSARLVHRDPVRTTLSRSLEERDLAAVRAIVLEPTFLIHDPLHSRAVPVRDDLQRKGARLFTSIPVVLETFTFLDRNAAREAANAWRQGLDDVARLETLECGGAELAQCWKWFDRHDLPKLSAVDATSFVLMKRHKVHVAFTFDRHFAAAGFRIAS